MHQSTRALCARLANRYALRQRFMHGVGPKKMRGKDWGWVTAATLAIPAAAAALAFMDATFELGVLHSTWQSAVAIIGFVVLGLCFLWQVQFRARWQRVASMLTYAPAMLFVVTWLGVAIQFAFDDCMSAQQAIPDDRPKTGSV
jgi:hypothetical protein